MPQMRPPVSERLFSSPAVETFIEVVASKIKDSDLQTLFRNTFPNTLDTTVLSHTAQGKGVEQVSIDAAGTATASHSGALPAGTGLAAAGGNDTFIVTGDIHAMWLRDSYNQVKPYIDVLASLRRGVRAMSASKPDPSRDGRLGSVHRTSDMLPASLDWTLAWSPDSTPADGLDTALARAAAAVGVDGSELLFLISGLIARQSTQVAFDPYANAFSISASIPSPHSGDSTSRPSFAGTTIDAMQSPVYERKYELDSLCAFLRLSSDYFAATGDAAPFLKGTLQGDAWVSAVETVLATMTDQQVDTATEGGSPPYFF